jgi:hypothetical protein
VKSSGLWWIIAALSELWKKYHRKGACAIGTIE